MTEDREIPISEIISTTKFQYLLLNELRSVSKSLRVIGKCLEKIANPPMKLDPNDSNAVKKASQAIKPDRG